MSDMQIKTEVRTDKQPEAFLRRAVRMKRERVGEIVSVEPHDEKEGVLWLTAEVSEPVFRAAVARPDSLHIMGVRTRDRVG